MWYHYTSAPSALLSITQLYGGQYKDFLTPYNVVSTMYLSNLAVGVYFHRCLVSFVVCFDFKCQYLIAI